MLIWKFLYFWPQDFRMKNIAVFASGNGSNAHQIIRYFAGDSKVVIRLVVTNNEKAGIINKCKQESVPCFVFPKDSFVDSDGLITFLIENNIDYIVLAGFLLQIPQALIKEFPKKIINQNQADGKHQKNSFLQKQECQPQKKRASVQMFFLFSFEIWKQIKQG